jgi:peptide chain release factor subunit 3
VFRGKSLLQTLDQMEPPERLLNCPARLPIVDKYNDMGTVVMGKLQAGVLKKGDKVVICPIDMQGTIVEIDRHGQKSDIAEPGPPCR